MMNGVTGVNVNTQNYQMSFGNKMSKAEREAYKIIDAVSDACIERSFTEKAEAAKRKSVLSLASELKCSYLGKILERGKATIEHIKTLF